MRFGLALPQYGSFTDPRSAIEVARAAETMGYDSLWVGDRLIVPEQPSNPYPGSRDGVPPQQHSQLLDPLVMLTVAATVTERVRLGASTLNALLHPPVLLARALATLDQVSAGRLDIGIGLYWSSDEYQAVGVPWAGRGDRLEETLDIFDTIWRTEVFEHTGKLWTVPRSTVTVLPVQRPRPPVLLGGFSPATLERVGRRADGWLAVAVPIPVMAGGWQQICQSAEAAGRDPQALRMVIRINPVLTTAPGDDASTERGTVEQLVGYIRAAAETGAHEILIDLHLTTTSTPELLERAAEVLDAVSDLHEPAPDELTA
jgi:probable F420-dependent oxidoreductase